MAGSLRVALLVPVLAAGAMMVDACGAGTTTSVNPITLTVDSRSEPTAIGGKAPPAGRRYVELGMTLKNGSLATIPAAQIYFSVATDQAVVLSASPVAALLTPTCASDTSVGPSGSFTCELAFEVPTGQEAVRLEYDDKAGHVATAPVPALAVDAGSDAADGGACMGKWGECNGVTNEGCSASKNCHLGADQQFHCYLVEAQGTQGSPCSAGFQCAVGYNCVFGGKGCRKWCCTIDDCAGTGATQCVPFTEPGATQGQGTCQ